MYDRLEISNADSLERERNRIYMRLVDISRKTLSVITLATNNRKDSSQMSYFSI